MMAARFDSPLAPATPLTPFKRLLSQTSSPLSPKSPAGWHSRKEDRDEPHFEVIVSPWRKCYNFFGCIAAGMLYIYLVYSHYLLTIDAGVSVILAEYCAWVNEGIRKKGAGEEEQVPSKKSDTLSDAEKGDYFSLTAAPKSKATCIASIVGYREDPMLFTKALESYITTQGCRFVLVCVDGNDLEDQAMVNIFQQVYTTESAVLNLTMPFVEMALQMDRERPQWLSDSAVISKCVEMAKEQFIESKLNLQGPGAITRLCVTQPHMHKKGIMFTAFVITLALSEILGVDYVWTSDSDSIVTKTSVRTTIETIAGDDKCAGASTALAIFNRNDSLVTKLGNSVFPGRV